MEQRPETRRPDAEKIDTVTRPEAPAADGPSKEVSRTSAGSVDSSIAAALSAIDRQRLLAVVARHGQPTIDRALAVDLVLAVLPESLQVLVPGADGARKLAARIADALLEDPASAARLERLVAAARSAPSPPRSEAP